MLKKILYALLSLVIAFGLWAYVITTDSPEWEEVYEEIPVVLSNESALQDRNLILLKGNAPTVTLKLKGSRSDLSKLNRSNITLKVDLARVYESGQQSLAYSISYPGDIPPNSVEVLSQSPKEITLSIAERKTKEVPVEPFYNGSVPTGFRTDRENIYLSKETVTVTGPAEVVDQITKAQISIGLQGKKETISGDFSFVLCDQSGKKVESDLVQTDVSIISVMLKIQRYKEIALKLDVIPGGGATEENATITMDVQAIRVSGSEQALQDLGDELLIGQLELGNLATDFTVLYYDIRLPEGIENLTGETGVNVEVALNGLVTKTLQVTQLDAIKVPKGLEVEILTKVLTVTVRGEAAVMEELTADDLRVRVNFSGAELGTDTYRAEVYTVASKFSGLGGVGDYFVDAEVSEAADATASDLHGKY